MESSGSVWKFPLTRLEMKVFGNTFIDICVTRGSDARPAGIFVMKKVKIIKVIRAFLAEAGKSANREFDQGVLRGFANFPVSQSIVNDRFMSCQMAIPRLDSYSCLISAEVRIMVAPPKRLLALLEVHSAFLAGGWP